MVSSHPKFVLNLLVCITYCIAQQKNVCKTFPDYYKNMQENENCYYNKDADITVPQIIQAHGYSVEEYSVITKDGYILTMFRIVSSTNSSSSKYGVPAFLQHGIATNCAAFVNTGSKSLGFILADAGYDVWLGNFRGTLYSNGHTRYNTTHKQYWNFGIHEMGVYDLQTQLDFVWKTTNKKIIYIGYSMGNTASFIYGTTYPKDALEKVKAFISLAPIVYLNDTSSIVKYIIPLWKYVEPALDFLVNGRITVRNSVKLNKLCLPSPLQMQLCEIIPSILFGFNFDQNDPETLPVTLLQNLDSVSVKTISHFTQYMETDKFQQYDYGMLKNLLKYGSRVPPLYDLSKMNVPVFLMRSKNDVMATKKNVERLYADLPQKVKRKAIYIVAYEKFSHRDFLNAKDVAKLLYDDLLINIKDLVA